MTTHKKFSNCTTTWESGLMGLKHKIRHVCEPRDPRSRFGKECRSRSGALLWGFGRASRRGMRREPPKHKVPHSYSAAEDSAASWTEFGMTKLIHYRNS